MNRILSLRKASGMSQKDLADILFVNQTAVSQWERGATFPGYDFLKKMADYFDVTTDYILGRSDDQTPPHEKKPAIEDDNGRSDETKLALRSIRETLPLLSDDNLVAVQALVDALNARQKN